MSWSCFSIRQRYNLKANHNTKNRVMKKKNVVFQYVKDTIWKQITTICVWRSSKFRLFFNTSKIQFESKSQPPSLHPHLKNCCFSIRQRYNLKANHNYRKKVLDFGLVVFQYVKDTIWKQITTKNVLRVTKIMLFFNTSKIQFESKSQPWMLGLGQYSSCFSIRQRYNLKANHNAPAAITACGQVVFQYVKDTIWKQITTIDNGVVSFTLLFFNTSKIQFESKSQPDAYVKMRKRGCFSIRQRYNLKANHNCQSMV